MRTGFPHTQVAGSYAGSRPSSDPRHAGDGLRVAIVSQDDYPSIGEVRPRKLATSLREHGHHVSILCWNSRKRPVVEDLGYATVHRFSYALRSGMYRLLSAPSPLNPLWVLFVLRMARRERADLLISSNLRIALPVILAGRLLGTPVILDLQENNPEVVKLYPRTRSWHYIMRSSLLVLWLERLCIMLAEHVWVVVDERLDALPAKLKRGGRISVLCHSPALDELPPERGQEKAGPFSLIFIGLFSPGVGSLELILRSLPHVIRRDDDIRLIVGGGRQMEPLVEELGIRDHVHFAGVIRPEDVMRWLQQGSVGIIAYDVSQFTNTTISVKLFQYMGAGLAVLSTPMRPTRRVVEEARCGVILPEDATEEQVAEIILSLKNSPEEVAAMGQRARRAVLSGYNWNHEFEHALRTMRTLASRKRGTPSESAVADPA